ncbi:CRISPR-associated endonuclease Cas2 [Colibacter massiliensis]|uniref:CRISPR-associated endonuclease Cas2 n=1 Tax=Colibacter massiliensis TaxID=1852379 RepID=UPI00266B495B|nr:CRISPR-associated endonuclease Cas2 [Colibacter massiliensis]
MRKRKYIVLIIYDVVDNKTRSRLVKCLERYGVRVQKSAFEALLTQAQCARLAHDSSRIIDESVDSLRIYTLDDILNIYTWGIGERKEQDCIIL